MSKKSRRARARMRNFGPLTKAAQGEQPQVSKPVPTSKTLAPSIESSSALAKMSQHQYVLPELKRIGIIAGVLLLILVVLTFVLG